QEQSKVAQRAYQRAAGFLSLSIAEARNSRIPAGSLSLFLAEASNLQMSRRFLSLLLAQRPNQDSTHF
ncbi:hypothetical protein A2U01_0113202, partial [Trifolium medium]|nr:hypothetical protein [Trifolium medium]